MDAVEQSSLVWHKRPCTNGECVEVAFRSQRVFLRNSVLAPMGPVLEFSHSEWNAFLAGVMAHEFDAPSVLAAQADSAISSPVTPDIPGVSYDA